MAYALKEKLESGTGAVGTFFEMGSTTAMECLALAGMDFAVIDGEHGPFGAESIADFICAAERRGMPALVRAKDTSRTAILKALDGGAAGVIVPDIRTMEEIGKIVSYAKYLPLGERGVAFGRGAGYGFKDPKPISDYMADANSRTMLIPQCETRECLEIIDDVVATDGVDGIFIGPFDLSTALGKPGQFTDPEVASTIERIRLACARVDKPCLIYADDGATAKARLDQGFAAAAMNMDTILLIRALREQIAAAKA